MLDDPGTIKSEPLRKLPADIFYTNPVYKRSFPDPFVLKYCGTYFAYCTGFADDGYAVGVARSRDLIDWEYLGGALKPLAAEPPYYWAPEVVHHNGKFYLYYSCGNEKFMEIRVAVSDRPDRGFEDAGYKLTREDFAIDAHIFIDDDGSRYLFYATDFLEHSQIGTGTVVDRMRSWFELERDPRPVTRAAYDWQVYDPNRAEKGGVKWHTVEGPTVFKYKGRYIEMFSGGNWQNESYGVAYASSTEPMSASEWRQTIDGKTLFPVLKTIPGEVVGPGHNSAVVGPNGRELFCVYHSWVGDERVMSIDRMGLIDSRLFVHGATSTPQLKPFRPAVHLESLELMDGWVSTVEGTLSGRRGSRWSLPLRAADARLEFSYRLVSSAPGEGAELVIAGPEGSSTLRSTGAVVEFNGVHGNAAAEFSEEYDALAFRTVTAEISGGRLLIDMDGRRMFDLSPEQAYPVNEFRFEVKGAELEIASLALTYGFEDRFERSIESIRNDWTISGATGIVVSEAYDLRVLPDDRGVAVLSRGDAFDDFEFAVSIRAAEPGATFGFVLGSFDLQREFRLTKLDSIFALLDNVSGEHLPLPVIYSPSEFRQFRFVRVGEDLFVESEDVVLGKIKLGRTAASAGIHINDGAVEIEMVRWVAIG